MKDFLITQKFNTVPYFASRVFAIAGNKACWAPRVKAYASANFFTLSDLDSGACNYFQPVDEDGQALINELYAGRVPEDAISISGHDLYVIDVTDMKI